MKTTRRLTRSQNRLENHPGDHLKRRLLLPDQGSQPTPLGTETTVTEKLDVLALKVKTNGREQTCQTNQQNWNKTKSLSKVVHEAGQKQQERYIHYVQETLWASEPFQGRPPEAGEGERERMVPGEWNGQRT